MATIFVIGSTGGVGRRLCKLLVEAGHTVLAMHRKPEQAAEIARWGATPVLGDLTRLDADGFARLLRAADGIVFTAGAGEAPSDLTEAIDGDGLALAVAAAKIADVGRFLLVSAFPDAWRDRETSDAFENYMRVKRLADVALVASGLDWVILRPGTLTDEPGSGRIRADLAIPYGEVSRDDVAATLSEILATPSLSRQIIELTEGEVGVGEAIARLA